MFILFIAIFSGCLLACMVLIYIKTAVKAMLYSFDIHAFLNVDEINQSFLETMPIIDQKLDAFFKDQLPKKMPIVSMFIGDKTIHQLKEVFKEELQHIFPELFESFIEKGNFNLKISEIVHKLVRKHIQKTILYTFILGCIWGGMIAFLTILLHR